MPRQRLERALLVVHADALRPPVETQATAAASASASLAEGLSRNPPGPQSLTRRRSAKAMRANSSSTRSAVTFVRRARAAMAARTAALTSGRSKSSKARLPAERGEYPARRAAAEPFRSIRYSRTNWWVRRFMGLSI